MHSVKHHFLNVSALILLSLFSTVSFSQAIAMYQLDKEARSEVVNIMAKKLNQQYVFPKLAKKTGEFINQQLAVGAYANILDGNEFADKLTKDLQSINHDKHMKVWFNPPPPPPPPSENMPSGSNADAELSHRHDKLQQITRDRHAQEDNYGFYKVERLEGNIGYIDLRYFSGSKQAKSTAISAMQFLQNTDALILDMRNNTGGSPDMVRFICSYFFVANTHLNSLYWREPDVTEEYWTLDNVVGKRRVDVPLYVLTSSKTFSGAEELSYNFKTQQRATLVGEVTGGGANPGGEVNLNQLFSMFMPMGTAINPITKTNWEGVGVSPDIKISADKSFDKAYQLAKISADQFRLKDLEDKVVLHEKLAAHLTQIKSLVNTDKSAAIAKTEHSLQQAMLNEVIDEERINMLGYEYLVNEKNIDMAIIIFSFNTQAFPGSFNAFDSLGEAYLAQGDNKLARQNYKKSLQLNPNNARAKKMLAQ